MRVFLDTNVLFSGLHSPRGAPNRILEAAIAADMEAVVSMDVLQELVRNIRRKAPRLIGHLNRFLISTSFEVVADPAEQEVERWYDAGLGSDAPVIAAALGAGVDYVCTGDRRLLARGRADALSGLRVVTPAELVRVLEGSEGQKAEA